MSVKVTRRGALAGGVGTLALGACRSSPKAIPGELGGSDFTRGHRIRAGAFPPAVGPVEDVPIVIAGGGVAGLAAGWRLTRAGITDFLLLDLEDRVGGNARSGRNSISAYPLGAHYLPVPNREATALRRMLAQFGMIIGEDAGAPVYDPYQLCADLEERLFWRGEWQEGLFPTTGLSAADHAQRTAFDAAMRDFSAAVGSDGRPAFAIPSAYSSSDPRFVSLDQLSFAQWLDGHGWTSKILRSYLRYCCRDDYGTEPEDVSAWAGIHYFAGRRGWAARGDGDRELTWPEGNARLAQRMATEFQANIRTAHSLTHARIEGGKALLDVFDHHAGRVRRYRADAAILAMPHFVAARVAPEVGSAEGFSYAPWIVANVSVSAPPSGRGAPLAWDNVSSASNSLGYVVATHQTSSAGTAPTVLSWYLPLSEGPPAEERRLMLGRSLADWQAIVRSDLVSLHPELEHAITRIDVWRWGHAMIRPTTGFIAQAPSRSRQALRPPLLLAHSDLGGLSLFEEAHYYGVAAAEAAMRHSGHEFESFL